MPKEKEQLKKQKKRKYVIRDWNKLEQEYLLGDYKSITEFFKKKRIPDNGAMRKNTSGWIKKRRKTQEKKSKKIIEKVIEKESSKEANKIISTKDTATKLLEKINTSLEELNKYTSRSTTKTEKTKYDKELGKPTEKTVTEHEEINELISIIDRNGLKQLTSALKDVNDILNNEKNPSGQSSLAKSIEEAWRNRNE